MTVAQKTLYLVRHAKSSWDDPSLADRDRPLNKRGKRNAPDMGQRLAAQGFKPQLIISSPANRARTTAGVIAGELGI
ncbi:MAG: histidine phosphatase family protein, partial [Gammaproteobacteria bacterium]|nr:histidine phosphatase family protein [Gammaproteobacteria bacterium]